LLKKRIFRFSGKVVKCVTRKQRKKSNHVPKFVRAPKNQRFSLFLLSLLHSGLYIYSGLNLVASNNSSQRYFHKRRKVRSIPIALPTATTRKKRSTSDGTRPDILVAWCASSPLLHTCVCMD